MSTAKFPQNLGGDRKENFFENKNQNDETLTGLLCLNINFREVDHVNLPVFGEVANGIVELDEVQENQIEYNILSLLGSVEREVAGFDNSEKMETASSSSSSNHLSRYTSIFSSNLDDFNNNYYKFINQKPHLIHKITTPTLQSDPLSQPLQILYNCNFPKITHQILEKYLTFSNKNPKSTPTCSLGQKILNLIYQDFGYDLADELVSQFYKESKSEVRISERIDYNVGILMSVVSKCVEVHGSEVFY